MRRITRKITKCNHKSEHQRIVEPEELLPDGSLICEFTIFGNPATKKNHQTAVWTKYGPRILPSKQYITYMKTCQKVCEDAWKNKGKKPIDYGIAIELRIYIKTWQIGDHVGYLQALGDIFQHYGIVKDDKWIYWTSSETHWCGGKDKDNPRVEVKIKRYRHPYETFRDSK